MNSLLKIALWGMGISALGTLPLGVLNVAAMQISVTEGVRSASLFSLGVALIEVVYVRISIVGINWIRKHESLLRWMDWIAFGIVAALAVSSFVVAIQPPGEAKSIFFNNNVNSFVLGMGMSAINPMQIPFWFGWSTVLFSRGILQPGIRSFNWYTIGIGLGTLIGLAAFVAGGQLLVQYLDDHAQAVNYGIASIFAITALIFLYRILFRKGSVAKLEEKGISATSVIDD
jgi:threonine/homoserine/homoserine lactone efflux protein